MEQSRQTWVSILAGILAVVLIIWLSPKPVYQAQGILLPAEKTRSPISPNVVVQLSSPPIGGKVMGYINIERRYPAPGQKGQKQIGQLAQQLAAQVGANVIVVNNFRLGAVTRSNFVYLFQATAYYAPTIQSARGAPLL